MNKDTLEELINNGLNSYKIAKSLGVSQSAVRYWAKKYGVKLNKRKKTLTLGDEKECPRCKRVLEVNSENFYFKKNGQVNGYCKECNHSSVSERQNKIKKEAVEYKGGKCCKCGYDKCFAALEFHHIDPSKKDFAIGQFKLQSFDNLKEEIDKCILVCSNCHKEIHYGLSS